MKNSEAMNRILKESNLLKTYYMLVGGASVLSLLATFLIANADFAFQIKALALAFIICFNLLIYFGLYFRQKRQFEDSAKEINIGDSA